MFSNNNKPAISPKRQICKRLTQKMKLKNLKNQRGKVLKHNGTQLKSNQAEEQSRNILGSEDMEDEESREDVISDDEEVLEQRRKVTQVKQNQQVRVNNQGKSPKIVHQEVEDQISQEASNNQNQQHASDQQDSQASSSLVALNQQDNQQKNNQDKPAWYFSDKKFTQFQLSQPTLRSLQHHGYKQMTHVQARSLPYLLKGRDVLGAAKTGSGKTLAYLIPCIEMLYRFQFKQKNGTGVIVITPTRQLAIQVFEVAKKACEFHNKTIGILIGGTNRKTQSNKLEKGVNLLICTPGRLLDHLQNSKFNYRNLLSLVIDQADALLRQGFEEQLNSILKVLPKQRQTILFSATQTQKVDELAKLSLKDPIYIGVDDDKKNATVQNLEQGFVIIPADKKFQLLFTFLQKQKGKKIMVFFSSCNSVKFFSDLLNYVDISVMDIHGKQKQQKRSTTFFEFGQMKTGVLLCTDVAARGLDIPQVDWIVQYDPPLDIKEYIHRVGRTARGHVKKGKALLFLLQQQQGYLKHLVHAKVQLNHYQFSDDKLVHIQDQYQTLVQKNHYLHKDAICAFKSYLHAYTTYSLKDVFNVHSLDLLKVAKGFGLKRAPQVQLSNCLSYVRCEIRWGQSQEVQQDDEQQDDQQAQVSQGNRKIREKAKKRLIIFFLFIYTILISVIFLKTNIAFSSTLSKYLMTLDSRNMFQKLLYVEWLEICQLNQKNQFQNTSSKGV